MLSAATFNYSGCVLLFFQNELNLWRMASAPHGIDAISSVHSMTDFFGIPVLQASTKSESQMGLSFFRQLLGPWYW
jgi:hypothetical protein